MLEFEHKSGRFTVEFEFRGHDDSVEVEVGVILKDCETVILYAVRILIQRSIIVLESNLESEGSSKRHILGEEGKSGQVHLRFVEECVIVAELLIDYKASTRLVQLLTLLGAVLIYEVIGAVAVGMVCRQEAGASVQAGAIIDLQNCSLGPNCKEDEQNCKHKLR